MLLILHLSICPIGIHSLELYQPTDLRNALVAMSIFDCYAQLCKRVRLRKKDLIYPIFVSESSTTPHSERDDMHGLVKIALKDLIQHVQKIIDRGISSVIIFGIPTKRDVSASSALSKVGIVQNSTKKIKKEFGGLINIITDVCICQYNLSGHCGLHKGGRNGSDGIIDNDTTLSLLAKIATSHAESGADIVAPSSMMDGQVKQIRSALNSRGFKTTKIMAFSAKYASSLYSPFRRTAYSKRIHNYTNLDKSSYQIGYENTRQAIREIQADIQEGADMIMVKPSLLYLDIVSMIKDKINFPMAVQNVSGECAMIKLPQKRVG